MEYTEKERRGISQINKGMKKTKSELNFAGSSVMTGRDKPIDEILYEDAKRRWEKQETKRKEMERLKDERVQSTKPPSGVRNSIYAAQKFEKEFYYAVHLIIEEQGDG